MMIKEADVLVSGEVKKVVRLAAIKVLRGFEEMLGRDLAESGPENQERTRSNVQNSHDRLDN